MAGGLPASVTTEIEFTTGTWTDVSVYVVGESGMGGTAGRADEYSDPSPRTWNFSLRNDDGRFTPDNPLSPYYPNVIENKRIRVTITKSATNYRWFTGYVLTWTPAFSDGDSTVGEVDVQAADLMATLARKTGESHYVEQARYQARFNASSCDTWTFGGSNASQVFVNSGVPNSLGVSGTAKMISSSASDGSWSVGTPDKLLLDGQLDFVPKATSHVGPVLRIKPGASIYQLEFFLSIPTTTTFLTGNFGTIADFVTESGDLFSLRLVNDATYGMCLAFYGASAIYNVWSATANMNDGLWRKITMYTNGAGFLWSNVDDSVTQFLWNTSTFDITAATRIYFGGQLGGPNREGKQSNCYPFSIAGIDIQYSATGVFGYYANGQVNVVADQTRFRRLAGYCLPFLELRHYADLTVTSGLATVTVPTPRFSSADIGAGLLSSFFDSNTVITAVTSPTSITVSSNAYASSAVADANVGPVIIGSDTDSRQVAEVSPQGSGMTEAFHTLARAVGGAFWCDPNGRPTLIRASAMRPTTPLASVDIEGDTVGDSLVLRRGADAVPTRVTVSGPIGDVKVINTAAEQPTLVGSPGVVRELSVSAACRDEIDAQILAGYYLSRSKALRVSQLSIDLVHASTDFYALFLGGGLRPGARLRLTGLSSAVFGSTTLDVIVQGWSESWAVGKDAKALFTFDLAPADQPVEGVLDDAEYGRFAADGTLALAFDITNAATSIGIIPTVSGAAVLSTSAGDYPLDLSVLGERMTVSGVPSTATRTNLVTNPSFETNTTGWSGAPSTYTAAAIARSSVRSYLGSWSLATTWPTGSAGASALQWTAAGLTIGQKYAFSVWAYVPAGSPRVRVADLFGTMTGFAASRLDTTGTTDGWVRLGFVATATAASHFFGLVTQDAAVSGQCVFADAALLELVTGTQGVGAYFDGANGGSWTGTAHASTSTVTAQNVTVTRGVSPTPARAHTAGEDVEIWHAAALAG